MNEFEIKILDAIRNGISCKPLDVFFSVYTKFGGVAFMILLSLVLIIIKKTRKLGICAGLAMLMGIFVGNFIIKKAVGRIRPYEFNKAAKLIVGKERDLSFPSGHAMACFALATSVFLKHKKAGVICYVAAVLMAFSRIYLYLHYPSDVLVGVILGIISAFAANFIVEKISKKYPKLKL